MNNPAGTFLEIARQHIAKKTITIFKYCDCCGKKTKMEFHRETKLDETYKCTECRILYTFTVR